TGVSISYLWSSSYCPAFKTAKPAVAGGIPGTNVPKGNYVTRFYANDDISRFIFCIQPGTATHAERNVGGTTPIADNYKSYNLNNTADSSAAQAASNTFWNTYFEGRSADNQNRKTALGLVMYYGYGAHAKDTDAATVRAYIVATQLLVWEIVLGYRGHTRDTIGTSSDVFYDDLTYPTGGIATAAATKAAYEDIVNAIKVHYDPPTGSSLYRNESEAKNNVVRFKYNSSVKRYEAKFTVPTSVVQSTSLRNWSGFRTALENTIKGKLNGTYGTDYGISTSTSGSNTVYTVWSNKNPLLNSSTVLTGSVNMIPSSSVKTEDTLFLKPNSQVLLYSPNIDPATAYFALGSVNEPNIVVEKTYKDASGITVTGTDLTGLLDNTEFIAYTVDGSTTYYVVANDNGTSYTFSEFTTNKSSATRFKYKSSTNTTGTFNLYDCPTNTSSAKTYTVEEVKTPSDRYEPLKTNVTLPVPTSSNQTNRVSFINEMSGSDYGTVALHKEISDAEIDPTTAAGIAKQSDIYKNTKFVVAYWGQNNGTPVLRFFTEGYKTAAPALSGDLSNLVDFTAVTYTEGDGCYYLPTRFNSDELVYDWTRTSEDIADAYVFDLGSTYSGTTTCDRFGQLYFNMTPLAGTEAKELLFVEIDSDDEYGYLKGTTSYTFDEVTKTPSANKRPLSGVMQLPATTIGGISCPAGAYPIVGLNGSATAHNSTAEMVNYPITYPLGFRKVNTETGEYVTGATYGLYDANKQLIKQTSETDSNGYYKFTELKPNRTYYVRELVAPPGFTLNENYYEVKYDYTSNGGVSMNEIDLINDLVVPETPYSVEISVRKYDQFTGYGIEGITFDIYRNNETAPVGSITTDADGKGTSAALYLGKLVNDVFENKYKVVERENDDYFMVDDEGNIIDTFTVSVTSADI
ncbi:MAG: Cys-Gln thioester bond-forming surface protein, partial [Ruminococcus sp.]|nr:Cys-Gln thioester bond-forming surface protein [Ruminococcus sp.]